MSSFFQQEKLSVMHDADTVGLRVRSLGREITAHYAASSARGGSITSSWLRFSTKHHGTLCSE